MADESPVQKYYSELCRQINEARGRYRNKVYELDDRYRGDFMRRDLEMRIAHAYFVMETADLERNKLMLIGDMVTEHCQKPIIAMIGP